MIFFLGQLSRNQTGTHLEMSRLLPERGHMLMMIRPLPLATARAILSEMYFRWRAAFHSPLEAHSAKECGAERIAQLRTSSASVLMLPQ